jgi:hypothetical protein
MRRRVATLAAAAVFALALSVTPVLAKGPGGDLTCAGGSVAGGTYDSITVTGVCMVDAGSITVRHDLVVTEGAVLVAAFGGSNVTVKGDLRVEKNGALALGCVPTSFACLDDDPSAPTYSAVGKVGHDLTADDALAVIVHNTRIGHDVNQRGGGGGLDCLDMVLLGLAPAYSTYEESTIGGSVSITGLRTCWLGFMNNTVGSNVDFNDNRTWNAKTGAGDPDGNEVVANTIGGDLDCARNTPAPQVGDSGLPLNRVGGDATGQCRKMSTRRH